MVLSGPTGSGKTLFLRALADLDPTDAGDVWLDGQERETMSPSHWRRRVMYLHQSGVTLPGTVRSHVLRLTTLGGASAPAEAVPLPPGLSGNADAERLSGGERQSLALHCALLLEPEVLLLDECTSALDPEAAARWEARVVRWVEQGHAALWVAHDRSLAERLGARRESFS